MRKRNIIIGSFGVLVAAAVIGTASGEQPAPVGDMQTMAPIAVAPTGGLAPSATATPNVTPKPTVTLTASQANAIEKAKGYLDYTAFSHSGLIDQLVYEGFGKADAKFAVDSLDTDWQEQAYQKALDYLDYSSFSLSGLIDQLVYEGFTAAQAKYGATKAYNE